MMNLVRPRRLREGDRIGIVAPASSADVIDPRVWDEGLRNLRRIGLEPVVGEHVRKRSGHTAGTVHQRLEDLHAMFADPEISAVMTVFGGFNSHQLLEHIDYDLVRDSRKVFVGYSDITALNIAFLVRAGLINFSGPAFITFCQNELPEYTLDHFTNMLMVGQPLPVRPSDRWADDKWFLKAELGPREWKDNPGWDIIRPGNAVGRAIGGNLSTLLLLSGTDYWPTLEGCILFVEGDEEDSPQLIDRYLTHMRHLGVFDRIAGMVFGRLPSEVGFNENDRLGDVIEEATSGYDFPIVSEVDFSHTDPLITIPIGVRTSIDTTTMEIRFLDRPVD